LTIPAIDDAARARLLAAVDNERAYKENQKQFQSDLTYFMLLTFLNTQRLKKKVDLTEASLSRDAEVMQITKMRLKVGHAIGVDILRAKGLYEKDNLKKLDTKSAYQKSRNDLATILGLPKIEEELSPLEVHSYLTPDEIGSLKKKIGDRPDIKNLFFNREATKNLVHQAEKESAPKLTLMGEVGVVGTHVVGGVGNAATGSIGLQLAFPIFDGGYFSGKAQEMSAKNMTISHQLNQAQLEAASQIEQAVTQLHDAKAALEASKSYSEIAIEENRLTKQKFKSGAASGMELVNSQVSLAQAAELEVDSKFSYELAKVNYYKAIGDLKLYIEKEGGI
jgi:multidrug efflux system outer membrane protein